MRLLRKRTIRIFSIGSPFIWPHSQLVIHWIYRRSHGISTNRRPAPHSHGCSANVSRELLPLQRMSSLVPSAILFFYESDDRRRGHLTPEKTRPLLRPSSASSLTVAEFNILKVRARGIPVSVPPASPSGISTAEAVRARQCHKRIGYIGKTGWISR